VDVPSLAQALVLAGFAIVALVIFRYARPIIHSALLGVFRAQETALGAGTDSAEEYAKRAATLEDLFAKLIRGVVVVAIVLVVFAVFNLWPLVAGLGIAAAALTLAGQSIVLDYLMGILILIEGQYFKGDTIRVGDVEGEVEEVGLRRTILRDTSGTVHSVSNGLIRSASNLTRLYAVLRVDITIVRPEDVERAIQVMNRVGTEMAADPSWKERLLEPPSFHAVVALTEIGATLRITGRVRPADRWAAPGELRRRLALELTGAGIEVSLVDLGLPPTAAALSVEAATGQATAPRR
jgi:small conductance mechanosensitive channel